MKTCFFLSLPLGRIALLHDENLLDLGRAEFLVRLGTHDGIVVLAHLVYRLLAEDLPVRKHHRQVVFVQRFACYSAMGKQTGV